MSCPEVKTLQELIADRLSDEITQDIFAHVEGCDQCRASLDRLSDDAELRQWRMDEESRHLLMRTSRECERYLERWIQRDTRRSFELQQITEGDSGSSIEYRHHLEHSYTASDLGMLGYFRVLREIGFGGMAVVFEAIDTQLHRFVAIKLLRPDQSDVLARERFLREAQAVAHLHHPHVVAIYGIFPTHCGGLYLAMELVDGGSLQERIAVGRLVSTKQAAEWIAQIADGLSTAHAAGIIHRDVKPGNILLAPKVSTHRRVVSSTGKGSFADSELTAKLSDFGLARQTNVDQLMTVAGSLLGTPAYMSPEQVAHPDRTSTLSDIYSLGVTFYELLTGEVPFRGAVATVLHRIAHEDPVPPRRLNAEVPRDLETICLKAMHRDPSSRYARASELADDLRRWLNGEPIHAKPVSHTERLLRWCRRHPSVATLIALVATLLILIATGSSWAAISLSMAETRLKLEKQNVELANERIGRAADEAKKQRQLAVESLNSLVTRVQTELSKSPGTLPLRNSILETALAGLDKITQETVVQGSQDTIDEDLQVRDHTTIEAHLRKGEVLDLLGRTDDAIAEFNVAKKLASDAVSQIPESESAIRDYANALTMQAEVARRAFASDRAEPLYREALEYRRRLVERLPNDQDALQALQTCMQKIADQYMARNQYPAARKEYELLLEHARASHQRFPDSKPLRRSLAVALERLGTLGVYSGDAASAYDYLDQSANLVRELQLANPNDHSSQADLAYVTRQLALLASAKGDHARAMELARNAIDYYKSVAESDPLDTEARMKLGTGWDAVYQVALAAGDLSAALDAITESIEIFEEMSDRYPTASKYAVLASDAHYKRCDLFIRSGKFDDAQSTLDRRLPLLERARSAADAKKEDFEYPIQNAEALSAALRLARQDHPPGSTDPAITPDVKFLANVVFMYRQTKLGNIEEAWTIPEQIEQIQVADPMIAAIGILGVARSYALLYQRILAEPNDLQVSREDNAQRADEAVRQALRWVQKILDSAPALRDGLRKELDFQAIESHPRFQEFFSNRPLSLPFSTQRQ